MRWTTIATSDTDIRGTDDAPGKSQVLTRADLVELCGDRSWLTDALINYGVEECDAVSAPLTDLKNNALWIRPALVKAGTGGDDATFDDTLGRAIGWLGDDNPKVPLDDPRPGFRNATVVLFPVNQGDTHWSLLAFYKGETSETCRFVHYDSLQPANDEAAQALVRKLRARGFLSRDFAITSNGDVVRQEDGYNCGMFVVLFARLIMGLGAAPGSEQITPITSQVCDEFRNAMRLALVPLVAEMLPALDRWFLKPRTKPSAGVSVELDHERRQEVLREIHKQLEEENKDPIVLSSIKGCDKADPSTITVVIESADPKKHDVHGGSVTFTINTDVLTRPVSYDSESERWLTRATLKVPEPVTVAVKAKVHPAPEFTEEIEEEPEFEVPPGTEKEIVLRFEPKEPRRLYTKFVIEDDVENADKEEKVRRPFPKDLKVEFVFNDGPDKVAATVQADGTVVEDEDKKPGVRVPFRYSGVWHQFPDAGKPQFLAWEKDSAAGSPTVILEDKEAKSETQQVGYSFPKGIWIPVRRPDNWEFPEPHGSAEELVRQIDVSKEKVPPGSAEEPLLYILKSQPPEFLMNGHLIEHVVCLMLENRGFDHFMGFLYEGANKPKFSYPPPGEAQGKHAGLRLFEGLEGLSPSCAYDYTYQSVETTFNWCRKKTTTKTDQRVHGVANMRRGAIASNIPRTNPHEDFVHIFQDMYGPDCNPEDMEDKEKREAFCKSGEKYKVPPMNGWAQNYCDGISHHRHVLDPMDDPTLADYPKARKAAAKAYGESHPVITNAMVEEIMHMYLPDQLPVMHGLARHYSVSDLWFCSVPSQTNTNRAFWCAGHAAGIAKNDFRPAIKYGYASDKMPEGNDGNDIPFRRSLFDVLTEHGKTWKYYWSVPYPPVLTEKANDEEGWLNKDAWKKRNYYYFESMFPQFKKSPNFVSIEDFYRDAQAGSLPAVSYIEPWWGGGKKWEATSPSDRAVGNEFHPVQDMFCGEFFVKKVYDALFRTGGKPDTTLLLITFDENGGTYDHFPPWDAERPDREENLPKGCEYGYEFDSYGVRVPTLVISKYVKPGTIFRSPTAVPFDHTSCISTILRWLAIDKSEWRLGERVANAPTFDKMLQSEGEEEAERRKQATGMVAFDESRKSGTVINYDDTFYLRYVGNIYGDSPPDAQDYLGDPATWAGYWYPTVTRDKRQAIKFKLTGGSGPVKNGDKVLIAATGKTVRKQKSMEGYSLAIPSDPKSGTIYLYTGGMGRDKPSHWVPWLHNDRNETTELKFGDKLFLFAESYDIENLNSYYTQPVAGVSLFDPYQKLTVEPYNPSAPGVTRYGKWRAGEWDMWVMEPV